MLEVQFLRIKKEPRNYFTFRDFILDYMEKENITLKEFHDKYKDKLRCHYNDFIRRFKNQRWRKSHSVFFESELNFIKK